MSRRQLKRLIDNELRKENLVIDDAEDSDENDDAYLIPKTRGSGKSVFTAAAILSSSDESSSRESDEETETEILQESTDKRLSDINQIVEEEIKALEAKNADKKKKTRLGDQQIDGEISDSIIASDVDDVDSADDDVDHNGLKCPLLSTDKGCFKLLSQNESQGRDQNQQPHGRRLAVQARGRILGSRNLVKKYWLIPSAIDDSWPRCDNDESLTMDAIELPNGTVFQFDEPRRYAETRLRLLQLINDGLGIQEFLQKFPFHIEGNFVWALLCLKGERHEEAFQALRRCLHSFQCSFHPKFSPFILDDLRGCPWPKVVLQSAQCCHALLLSALFLYAHLLSRFAAHGPALEVYKLLFSCDPNYDSTHSLLHMHHSALRLTNLSFLTELAPFVSPPFISLPSVTPVLLKPSLDLFLPSFAFSVAICRLRRCPEIPKVAFFQSIDHPEVSPHRYCLMHGLHKNLFNNDVPSVYDDGKFFFTLDSQQQYWDTSSTTDQKMGQLLLMRSLVLYPKFIRYFLQHFSITASTIPQNSRSVLTWNDLLCSPAFSYNDDNIAIQNRENQIVNLATQQLLKMFILKSHQILETPALVTYIHECASIIHYQYVSNLLVEVLAQQESDSGKNLLDQKQQKTEGMSQNRLRSHCWNSVSKQRSYRIVIDSFRSVWLEALIEFYKTNRMREKYEDVKKTEFDKHKPELPDNLRLSLTHLEALLGHKQLGLGHTYKAPLCWLSLHSNPFLLFFQSAIPFSVIDHQGSRSKPLTWVGLCRSIQRTFCNRLFLKIKVWLKFFLTNDKPDCT